MVGRVLDECAQGVTACYHQPGHPHGFHTHMYAGEVHHSVSLHDPEGDFAALQARTTPYPPELQRTIVRRYLWEAGFAHMTAAGAARRGDVFYVTGCLFRAVASLVQVVFALNERYFLNEKGSVREATGFARTPPDFAVQVADILGGLEADPKRLRAALDGIMAVTESVRVLCGPILDDDNAP